MESKTHRKGKIITRTVITIVIIIIGFVIFYSMTSHKTTAGKKSESTYVRTLAGGQIKIKPIRLTATTYGTARAKNSVSISSEVQGKVSYLDQNINNGSIVDEGEIIAKIDQIDYEIALNISIANINELKSSIEQQKFAIHNTSQLSSFTKKNYEIELIQYNRIKGLEDKNVVSPATLDDEGQQLEASKVKYYTAENTEKFAKIKLKTLNSKLVVAVSEKEKNEVNLKRCIIKSPFRGRIKSLNIEKDEYVTPGTKLFEIIDDNSLEIPISLSLNKISLLFNFNSSKIQDYKYWFSVAKQIPISIEWSDNLNSFKCMGQLISVSNFNTKTQTVSLLVKPDKKTLKSNEFPLVSGMFCTVIFKGKELKNVIKVPINSLQLNNSIYIVGSDNRVMEKRVKIISYTNNDAIISDEGLKDTDKIVMQQIPQGLTNGTNVKIVKPLAP